jgi:hypothetical protein
MILMLAITTYGVLLILFVFAALLTFSSRWASLGWAILSGLLVGLAFVGGQLLLDVVF